MFGGERDQEVLGAELAAGAEAAADIVLDQIDGDGREPQHRGQGIAIKERHLGGAQNCHSPLSCIPFGEDATRLHRQCGIALHLEALTPDVRSIAKCRLGVADHGGEGHREIGTALLEQQQKSPESRNAIRGLGALVRDPKSVRIWAQQQMPGFPPTVLPDTDLNALIAYLKQIVSQRGR
jgi:hypothetical protein